MRHNALITSILCLLSLPSSSAAAGETRPGTRFPPHDRERELVLSAGEVATAVEPWTPNIRACWLEHAPRRARADGNLRVQVVVDPAGMVWQRGFVYAGRRDRALDRCLGQVVEQWRFPWRRGYTHAAVPYVFRATTGPGHGPYPTCRNARGCRRPPRS